MQHVAATNARPSAQPWRLGEHRRQPGDGESVPRRQQRHPDAERRAALDEARGEHVAAERGGEAALARQLVQQRVEAVPREHRADERHRHPRLLHDEEGGRPAGEAAREPRAPELGRERAVDAADLEVDVGRDQQERADQQVARVEEHELRGPHGDEAVVDQRPRAVPEEDAAVHRDRRAEVALHAVALLGGGDRGEAGVW